MRAAGKYSGRDHRARDWGGITLDWGVPMNDIAAASAAFTALPSSQELRAAELAAINAGKSALELMERAGHQLFSALQGAFPRNAAGYLILAGPGNNGGDGCVVARLCRAEQVPVRLVMAAADHRSPECAEVLHRAERAGVPVALYGDAAGDPLHARAERLSAAEIAGVLTDGAVVVDALQGSGQRRAPHGSIAELLAIISVNRNSIRSVVSIDVPTGVNADSGEIYDGALKADRTIAIELCKRGLLQAPAADYCGMITEVKIGIGADISAAYRLNAPARIARRRCGDHKGTFGHLLILGGAPAFAGAAQLAALGALHCGVGKLTKSVFVEAAPGYDSPETMRLLLPGSGFTAAALPAISAKLNQVDAVVLGPGFGADTAAEELFVRLIEGLSGANVPVVLDADALNLLASSRINLPKHASWILTPHPGEAARLLGISHSEVQRDRFSAAERLYQRYSAVVVLKGYGTLIVGAEGGRVNRTGTPYMATGGTGDVLSGVIGALLARGVAQEEAARLAVFLHGRAGELASLESGGPILASALARRVAAAAGEWSEDGQ